MLFGGRLTSEGPTRVERINHDINVAIFAIRGLKKIEYTELPTV